MKVSIVDQLNTNINSILARPGSTQQVHTFNVSSGDVRGLSLRLLSCTVVDKTQPSIGILCHHRHTTAISSDLSATVWSGIRRILLHTGGWNPQDCNTGQRLASIDA